MVVVISSALRFLFSNSFIVNINQLLVPIYNLQSFIFIILGSILLGVLFVVFQGSIYKWRSHKNY